MKAICIFIFVANSLIFAQENSLEDLLKQLESAAPTQKFNTVEAIGKLKDKAQKAIPSLEKLLLNTESSFRLKRTIVEALVSIGPASFTTLGKALQDKDENIRVHVLKTLLKNRNSLDKDFVAFLPHLQQALHDKNSEVRDEAIDVVTLLGQEYTHNILILHDDPVWQVRKTVAEVAINAEAQKAIPMLKKMLNDQDWRVRMMAAKSLAHFVTQDQKIIGFLAQHHDQKQQVIRSSGEILQQVVEQKTLELSQETLGTLLQSLQNNKKNAFKDTALFLLVNAKSNLLETVPLVLQKLKGKELSHLLENLEEIANNSWDVEKIKLWKKAVKGEEARQTIDKIIQKIQKKK